MHRKRLLSLAQNIPADDGMENHYYTGEKKTVPVPELTERKEVMAAAPAPTVKEDVEPVRKNSGRDSETISDGIKRILVKHADRTSLNGVPYIYQSSNILVRICWSFLLFAAIVMMCFHLHMLLAQFFRYEKTSEIHWLKSKIQFPAVTICNVNLLRMSKKDLASKDMHKMINEYDPEKVAEKVSNLTPTNSQDDDTSDVNDDEDTDSNLFDDLDDDEDGGVNDAFDDDLIDEDMTNSWETMAEKSGTTKKLEKFRKAYFLESLETRRRMGHRLHNMLISSSFKGRKLAHKNFTLFQSPDYGNCYTLSNDKFVVKEGGPQNGLEMILHLETWEYIPGFTTSKGLQLMIHEPETLALPDEQGIAINAGANTHIGLRQVKFKRLPLPYPPGCDQMESFKEKYGVRYSRHACQRINQQEQLRNTCKCFDNEQMEINAVLDRNVTNKNKTSDLPNCGTKTQVACKNDIEWSTIKDDLCPDPCEATGYEQTISSRQWPELEFAKIFVDTICKTKPAEYCAKLRSMNGTALKNEFVRIRIYFETTNYEEMTDKPKYEVTQFYSDIGGTIGLWIGFSLLGIFEFFHFIIHVISWMVVRHRNRKTQAKTMT